MFIQFKSLEFIKNSLNISPFSLISRFKRSSIVQFKMPVSFFRFGNIVKSSFMATDGVINFVDLDGVSDLETFSNFVTLSDDGIIEILIFLLLEVEGGTTPVIIPLFLRAGVESGSELLCDFILMSLIAKSSGLLDKMKSKLAGCMYSLFTT